MKYVLPITLIFLAANAEARVVSYPGGTMPMFEVTEDYVSASVDYSPSAFHSFGLTTQHFTGDNAWLYTADVNWLAYRHNAPSSQTNFYLMGGAGMAEKGGETAPAGRIGMIADWEDRRWMVAYQNHYIATDDAVLESHFEQRARVGIAPYKASYEEWQPWIILQADHEPEDDTPLEVGPVLRAFRGPILAELGITNRGNIYAALNLQF
ncbi:MAG: hypothetical protein J0M34_05975 [Alphaproteobacteria bacterium]|nr:hypothetical protein [Alphaproteobacteria bacterium]